MSDCARLGELERLWPLLADAEQRRFDVVLVTRVDRISRSLQDLLRLLEALREHGVEFAAVDQDFDTGDPAGLLTLHIMGSFAQFERELLVERIKEGHLSRLKARDWSCGPVPYGYRKEDGKLVEKPKEAEVARRIFRLFLRIRTYKGVARKLNEEGLPGPRGSRWYAETVKGILGTPSTQAAMSMGGTPRQTRSSSLARSGWYCLG